MVVATVQFPKLTVKFPKLTVKFPKLTVELYTGYLRVILSFVIVTSIDAKNFDGETGVRRFISFENRRFAKCCS
jgi:hypothetical protein